jgi:hypothetical protein
MENQNEVLQQINSGAFKVIIEGKFFEVSKPLISGRELKELGGIPLDTELYLSLKGSQPDELVGNEHEIESGRAEIDYFYVRKKLEFTINKKPYEWFKQYITGLEIRELGEISSDDEIYLSIPPPYENELIAVDTRVDLARPGLEHFFSKEKPFRGIIIVNGREKAWEEKTISFQQVVTLAFGSADQPNRVYTVTYCKGPEPKPEGTMSKGSIVSVKNKMIFNVTATDKS